MADDGDNPFLKHTKPAATGTANPFMQHAGGGTAVADAPLNPFMQAPVDDVVGPGAASIAAGEDANYQQNITGLKAVLQKPGVTPGQRSRIEGMIKRYEEPSIAGIPVGNRVTAPNRSGVQNLARGTGAGLINYGIIGASDLLAGGAQLLLPKSWENAIGLPQFREKVADSQQIVKEWFDPQGLAGGAGTVVGAFAGGFAPTAPGSAIGAAIKPFEVLNSAGMKAVMRVSPKAAAVIAKGTVPGATFLQRLAAQAVGSAAVDGVQVADVLTNDEMTTEQKIHAVTLAALASGGAGAAAALRKIKPSAAEVAAIKKQHIKGPKAPDAPQPGATPERAAQADEMAATAIKNQALSKENKKLNRLAKAEWETQNIDKDWKADLTPEQQTDILAKFRARYAKSNISTEAAQPAQGAETPLSPPAAPTQPVPEAGAAGAPPASKGSSWTIPGDPDVVQVVSKNTKKGEKGYRITAFMTKQNEFGQPAEVPAPFPHQSFDTYEEAVASLKKVGAVEAAGGGAAVGAGGDGPAVGEASSVVPAGREVPASAEQPAPVDVQSVETPVDAQITQLQTELAQTRQQRDLAQRQAETDNQTGLANKNAWLRAIPTADKDPNIKVVLFDLLNLKAVNDKASYDEGSQYIIDAARSIETAARTHASDANQTPRVFRYGGDEFGVLLPVGVDHEAVAATARQILGASSVEGFPTGLRHGDGATVAQAEASMAARKAGETAPSYRGGRVPEAGPVEQVVPGVELKKPLARHSVEELDNLYDKIDKQFDTGKITDAAYKEGIYAVSEAKRQLKRSGVKVESLEPAKRGEKPADAPKVDNAAAKDAGYMPGEYKTADIRVNEGHAIRGGKLEAVTRDVLEEVKANENAAIAKDGERREKIMAMEEKDWNQGVAETVFGHDIRGAKTKGEALSLIERRIKESKGEIDRFTRQHARFNEANPSHQPPPRPNPADALIVRGTETSEVANLRQPPELQKVVDRTVFRKQMATRLDKMPLPDLEAHRDDLSGRLLGMTKKQDGYVEYHERLAKVNEQIAARARPPEGSGVTLQTDPRTVGFAIGFGAGLTQPVDDEQDRWRNALYWGAAGALGAHAGMRMLQHAKDKTVPGYQQEIREHVRSVEDAPLERRKGMFTTLLERYGNIARRDIGITAVTKVAGGANLPAGRNPGKMAEIFGLWRGMTDRWMFGDRVGVYDSNGDWVQFDSMTMQGIAQLVDGDLRSVGDLAAAKRELELRSMPEPRTTGLGLEASRKMFANSSEKLHAASTELTKFFRAMKDLSVMSGIISPEQSAKMDEQAFYVAVRRLFDNQPGTSPGAISTKGASKSKTASKPESLFKNLKGGRRPYQNPAEAAIDLLPRYHRAGELNRLATTFFDMLSALPTENRKLIGKRMEKADIPKIADVDAKVQMLRDELASQGSHMGEREAEAFISALSDESLNLTNDVVRFYRNGEMEAWRVSDPIAKAFRNLQPHELDMLMGGAGIITKPTNLARVGITANPVFVGYQAFRDIWQYHQNGAYAVGPNANPLLKIAQAPFSLVESGIGSVRGYLAQMFRTGEYLNYANVGAGGESVASQGLKVIRGGIKQSTDLLERVSEVPARNQFEQIYKEIKTGSFREAYSSILAPIADAGRVGAYLKERGRGSDVLEAVYRAKKAGANFSNRGDSLLLQAANRATLFLNPAIQGMDASRHAFQTDPIGYVARGIAGVTIPSMLLWAAYKDDEEITQLRSTPSGKRFWFFRLNGEIHKVPKPIFEGQVFGSSAESWLDAKLKEDPEAMRNWAEGMYNDASVNLLPFVGVAPISLMTGKVVGLGSNITPHGTQGLDMEYRARPDNSVVSRIVSKAAAPTVRKADLEVLNNAMSPAGVDFLINNYLGGLGSELTRLLSTAIQYRQTGDLPPNEEFAFIRSVYGQYPSMNTAAIQEFYRHADIVEQSANTAAFIAETKPGELATYLETRGSQIQQAELYSQTRTMLNDYRKTVEDLRQAPREVLDDTTRRELIKMFMERMIQTAKTTNEIARTLNTLE